MLIYIAGIPGTGKTTIIKSLIEKLNFSGHKSVSIRGLPILCKLTGNISPEEFRKLPDSVREKYRPEMFKIIYEEDLNDFETIRILDGHFAYYEAKGKEYSIREIRKEDYEQMKAIFVIISEPEKILERRNLDSKGRTDRTLDLEHIREQENIEKDEAIKQAKELKVPILFISNNSDISSVVNEIYLELSKVSFFENETKSNLFREIKMK
ncbi:MAG: AAA family ATPase [Candidatus Parcubacteria bacterium]|nr:AAA family ATPase [Candidatus Parcubacteria bacterium]